MKKLLLSLTVLTGLVALSMEAPKYEIDASVGYSFVKTVTIPNGATEGTIVEEAAKKTETLVLHYVVPSISVAAKWEKEINDQMKVTFGPKVSGVASIAIAPSKDHSYMVLGSGVVGFEYAIQEDLNVYAEAEAGIGPKITPKDEKAEITFGYAVKASAGVKYKNYKVGAFAGYGKGIAGIELGYEF